MCTIRHRNGSVQRPVTVRLISTPEFVGFPKGMPKTSWRNGDCSRDDGRRAKKSLQVRGMHGLFHRAALAVELLLGVIFIDRLLQRLEMDEKIVERRVIAVLQARGSADNPRDLAPAHGRLPEVPARSRYQTRDTIASYVDLAISERLDCRCMAFERLNFISRVAETCQAFYHSRAGSSFCSSFREKRCSNSSTTSPNDLAARLASSSLSTSAARARSDLRSAWRSTADRSRRWSSFLVIGLLARGISMSRLIPA